MARSVITFAFGRPRGLGGTERRLLELASSGLLPARMRIVVMSDGGDGGTALTDALLAVGADVQRCRSPIEYLRALAKEQGPLIAAGHRAGWHAVLASRGAEGRRPVYLLQNGLEFGSSRIRLAGARCLGRFVEAVIANSHTAAVYATEIYRRPSVRIVYSSLAAEWLGPLSTAPEVSPLKLVMVGTSRLEKNHLRTVDAFLSTRRPELDMELHIYTDSRSTVRPVVVGNRRIFVHHNQVMTPSLLDSFHIALHPSISESLPRAGLEALSRGLIVVGSRSCGDLGNFLTDQRLIVDALSTPSIRNGIEAAVDDCRARNGQRSPRSQKIEQLTIDQSIKSLVQAVNLDMMLSDGDDYENE